MGTHCPPGHVRKTRPRCANEGTAPAPGEARRYSAEIAPRGQSRRGDKRIRAGSEVAPRLALGPPEGGLPDGAAAASRPLSCGRPAARRLPPPPRGTEPDRRKGGQGGNSPLPQEGLPDGSLRPEGQAGPTAARGEPSRPSPPAIRGRGRRRLAGGPSRLRPLSCGRGAAGWKGPVRRIRRSLPAPNSRAGWGGDPREGANTCSARPPPAEGDPGPESTVAGAERPPTSYPRGGPMQAAQCPAAILRPCAAGRGPVLAPQAFGRSPIEVPPPPPLSCGGGTVAREPPPFPGRYPAAVGGGDRVRGSFSSS